MRLDLPRLQKEIPGLLYRQEIDSTSLYARRLIESHSEPLPQVVLSSHQTNGQGRKGKSFFSPAGTGLYATFLLHTDTAAQSHLTPRIAVALQKAIGLVFSKTPSIKWVNDLYLNDRKIAGILCQTVRDWVLVGVGINVEMPAHIPEELRDRFGAVTQTCGPEDGTELFLALCRELKAALTLSFEELHRAYTASLYGLGREALLLYDRKKIRGKIVGVDPDFSLLLLTPDGVKAYSSGQLIL